MLFKSGKQSIELINLDTVKNVENIDFTKLEIKPLTGKIRTNRLVISKNGDSYGKEVPVKIFLLGGIDSKITQFSSFYEDETCYRYMQGRVILAQIIMFEKKPVSIEYSPQINDLYFRSSKNATLVESQKVWRYMDLFKLEDIIKNKSLFFNRIDKFKDDLEGISPQSCEECILNTVNNKSKEEKIENIRLMKERFKHARKSTFTSCWHVNDFLNERMWIDYANTRDSIAVETTYGNLLKVKEEMQFPLHIEQIRYFDEPYVNQESYWFPFLFKRKEPFEWEKELRLSIYAYNYDNLTHLRVKAPIYNLIKKIHLSPLAKKYEVINLERILKLHKVNLPVYFKNKRVI